MDIDLRYVLGFTQKKFSYTYFASLSFTKIITGVD